MNRPDRSPARFAIPALLLAFLAVGIASGARDRPDQSDATAKLVAAVEPISHRVELIRGVRFKRVPRPEVVSADETRETVLEELDKEYPEEKRSDDAELLELLGLVEPGTDLREVSGDISGGQVIGFYDPRKKRLAVVRGPAAAGAVGEITLAHELTHALEDQRFDIREQSPSGADDGATAYTALIEGTATAVMNVYTERFIPPSAAIASAFSALGPAEDAAEKIPPYIQRSLEFSYIGGERFVQALRERGGGWTLVNLALSKRPPASTEQVLHPEKYIPFEAPIRVRVGSLGLGEEWKRASDGTIGELDTRELLGLGAADVDAEAAAAGWGGGQYELWRSEDAARDCDEDPCRRAAVLVLRWRWDSARDAREFAAALPSYVEEGLDGQAAGAARWRVGDGGAAIAATGGPAGATTLVFAPSPDEAARLAASAGR